MLVQTQCIKLILLEIQIEYETQYNMVMTVRIILKEEIVDIMKIVMSPEDPDLLINDDGETIKNEPK